MWGKLYVYLYWEGRNGWNDDARCQLFSPAAGGWIFNLKTDFRWGLQGHEAEVWMGERIPSSGDRDEIDRSKEKFMRIFGEGERINGVDVENPGQKALFFLRL